MGPKHFIYRELSPRTYEREREREQLSFPRYAHVRGQHLLKINVLIHDLSVPFHVNLTPDPRPSAGFLLCVQNAHDSSITWDSGETLVLQLVKSWSQRTVGDSVNFDEIVVLATRHNKQWVEPPGDLTEPTPPLGAALNPGSRRSGTLGRPGPHRTTTRCSARGENRTIKRGVFGNVRYKLTRSQRGKRSKSSIRQNHEPTLLHLIVQRVKRNTRREQSWHLRRMDSYTVRSKLVFRSWTKQFNADWSWTLYTGQPSQSQSRPDLLQCSFSVQNFLLTGNSFSALPLSSDSGPCLENPHWFSVLHLYQSGDMIINPARTSVLHNAPNVISFHGGLRGFSMARFQIFAQIQKKYGRSGTGRSWEHPSILLSEWRIVMYLDACRGCSTMLGNTVAPRKRLHCCSVITHNLEMQEKIRLHISRTNPPGGTYEELSRNWAVPFLTSRLQATMELKTRWLFFSRQDL